MPDLAIIIVSWNVRDLLRRCLHSVVASLAQSGIDYQIVVVDNASSDGTPAMLYTEFPQVQVYELDRNLGFAAANNLALSALGFSDQPATVCHQAAVAAAPRPTYILLLNPDTEIVADALPQLVAYLAVHPDLVAVGPQLRYATGHMQSSRRRFPTRLTFFWESTPLERCWPTNPWARRYHCLDCDASRVQRVDWLVGAALLVRGTAISQVGLLDTRFFMYSEELEWQYRLQATVSRRFSEKQRSPALLPTHSTESAIAYLPQAVIIHYEGQSSEQVPVARHLHFQQSKLRLACLLYGRWFALVVRMFVLVCYVWELASESIKFALGHRRPLRRQRIGVYATLLRSGLRSEHQP